MSKKSLAVGLRLFGNVTSSRAGYAQDTLQTAFSSPLGPFLAGFLPRFVPIWAKNASTIQSLCKFAAAARCLCILALLDWRRFPFRGQRPTGRTGSIIRFTRGGLSDRAESTTCPYVPPASVAGEAFRLGLFLGFSFGPSRNTFGKPTEILIHPQRVTLYVCLAPLTLLCHNA